MGDQTRPSVHIPPPGPRSAALLKRADDIFRGVPLIGARTCVELVEDNDTREPALNCFRPSPALNQPPELFAPGCGIVEECIADVSKAHAKGVK